MANTGPLGKERGALAVILLSILTIGIYSIVWQYKSFKEIHEHSGAGPGGAVGLLLAIFFSIANIFLLPSAIGDMYKRDGQAAPVSGATGFWVLLPLLGGIVWLVKVCGAMNHYWRAKRGSS